MNRLFNTCASAVTRAYDRQPAKNRKGQNTVEYLLMLAVIVGVVLIAGAAIKSYMPGLFGKIQGMINGAAGSLGSGGGNQ